MRNALAALLILAATGVSGSAIAGEPERHEFTSNHMGTQFRFVAIGDAKTVESVRPLVVARIAELDRIFSDYKADSEVMKLCKANDRESDVFRPVSRDVVAVLKKALALSKESDGAFDVTVGPLTQLWRITRRTQKLPDAKELTVAKSKVGYDKVIIDEPGQRVKLAVPGMRLDFGGIVKGYAADEALAIFAKHGLKQALVAASGDVRVGDAPPGKAGWEVEIEPLAKTAAATKLLLKNRAVSTSGDLFQFVEIGGIRFSHVLDPKTGLGLTGRRSVTVIAKTGIEADSLTKACSVLSPDRAVKLIDSIADAVTFIATRENDDATIVSTRSKHFRQFVVEPHGKDR